MPTEPEPLTLAEKRGWLDGQIAMARLERNDALNRIGQRGYGRIKRAREWRRAQREDYLIAILEAELTRIGVE